MDLCKFLSLKDGLHIFRSPPSFLGSRTTLTFLSIELAKLFNSGIVVPVILAKS